MAAQPIRVIRCIFRCIREMLVCIAKIRVIREIRGLKERVGNFSYNISLALHAQAFESAITFS